MGTARLRNCTLKLYVKDRAKYLEERAKYLMCSGKNCLQKKDLEDRANT